MKTYSALIVASVFVDIKTDSYKDAIKKGLKSVDDLQHATTGALKYIGVKWELDCVQEK